MCIGIPAKVIKINDKKATVSQGAHTHLVDISLVLHQKIKKGDYLLVASDVALNKIEKTEAEKIFNMIKEIK